MNRRFAVYISFSVLIALLLIGSATLIRLVETRQPSADIATWIEAQRTTPLLWLMDVAAFSLLFMMFRAGAEVSRSQQLARVHAELAAEQLRQQEEHHRQIEALIARNVLQEKQLAEMEEINQERAVMVSSLEAEAETRQREFEAEARRLTEQAFHAMQGTVEAQGRQLDAVNMALQYHRAEVTQLRHGLYALTPTSEPAQIARLALIEARQETDTPVVKPPVAPPPFLDYLACEKERAIDRVRATVPLPDSVTHLIPEVTAEDFSLPAVAIAPEEEAESSPPPETPAENANGAQSSAPHKWQVKI
jgi:hypothetical protein